MRGGRRAVALGRERYLVRCASAGACPAGARRNAVNENFSLIVMCIFMVLSLAFLAQQITAYH
jgi:hypothetical protein